jgi:DNA polymerase-3 subunit beta
MELSLLQENLNLALQNVSRFVAAKAQLPILNNILFSTDQGRLKLSATNLEIGINYWLGAKITKEGSITIPAREITEFVSYLSPGKIDLELNQNNLLTLSSPKAESTFTTIPANDFPILPSINPETSFNLDLALLNETISQVALAAATDDTRPVLTAILCQFTADNLLLVATDGFRLSIKNIKLVNRLKLKTDHQLSTLLIPARSLIEVTKLARNAKTLTVGLTPDEHQVVFVLEDLELVSRLIEGEYPDYKRILPDSYKTKVFLNRDEFSQAIKIVSVFARESANVVKFNIKSSGVELSANAPQLGQNKATVEARVEGEPLEIAFNFKFISDFLSVCQGQELVIELNENLTPGSFRDQSDPSFTHIIMPFRLQD